MNRNTEDYRLLSLGENYQFGRNVLLDYARAIDYYQRAADFKQ